MRDVRDVIVTIKQVIGSVKAKLVDSTGADVTAANPLPVTGTVTGTVPLPTGAATAALQTTGNTSLSTIASKDFATQTTLALVKTAIDSVNTALASQATAALQTTGNSLLTDIKANQTNATQKTQLVDGSGNVIGSTSNALHADVKALYNVYPDGTNKMPSGDALARSIYARIGDGTNGYDAILVGDSTTGKRGMLMVGTLTTGAARIFNFISSQSDALSNGYQAALVTNYNMGFNGTSWDRLRSVNTGQLVITQKNSSGTEPAIQAANAATSTSSVVQLAQLVDVAGRKIAADSTSPGLRVVTDAHAEIHESNHFFYADSLTLASAATQDYLITTPDTTKWGHFVLYVDGTAITSYLLFEGADRTGTTLQSVYNNDRNSATTAGITIHKGTSGGTTDGTQIDTYSSGFAAGAATHTPSTSREEVEKILKQNTKYILRVTSGTNGNLVNVRLNWYEHTNA